MSPSDVIVSVKRRLAAEIEDDKTSLSRLADGVRRLSVPSSDEWMRSLALAFEIERYYTAVEATLVRVVRTLDGDVPSGAGWHGELLRAASVAVEGLRPEVLDVKLAGDLRELLRFRHLVRHGYDAEPDLVRMVEHAMRVAAVHPNLLAQLDRVARWLREST